MENSYLSSVIKQFQYYKLLGDKTFEQLTNTQLHHNFTDADNNIATIVKHMVGNMLSRWTNFLTEDGEKPWRHRDQEFMDTLTTKTELLNAWEDGWTCLLNTLQTLTTDNLEQIIYIRNEGHTVTEAINRQLAHYSYHVGQIVYLGKLIKAKDWISLSIPKGESENYNQQKFAQDKGRRHFTDDL